MLKKFLLAGLLAILVSVNVCYAASDRFSVLAKTSVQDDCALAIAKSNSGGYYIAVIDRYEDAMAYVPFNKHFYNFYVNKAGEHYTVVIFPMYTKDDRNDVDTNLGEWEQNIHIMPVYVPYSYDGQTIQVIGDVTSGKELHPTHYQDRVQNPDHIKFAKVFVTRMADLHQAVNASGVTMLE